MARVLKSAIEGGSSCWRLVGISSGIYKVRSERNNVILEVTFESIIKRPLLQKAISATRRRSR